MKQGKRLTRKQKIVLKDNGLNPDNWLAIKNLPQVLHVVNKESGKAENRP